MMERVSKLPVSADWATQPAAKSARAKAPVGFPVLLEDAPISRQAGHDFGLDLLKSKMYISAY